VSAGQANIPKEGSYAIDFCVVGRGNTMSAGGDKFFVITYAVAAITRSTPPGGPFDRMGARCYGVWKSSNGTVTEAGGCELTDVDKWWMDVLSAKPDGNGGYYKAVWGTGKYEGMTLQGEFRNDHKFGSIVKDVAVVACDPNKGIYKLK
jgi:hypothetical protein